jgi:hypothetical protein
MFINLGELGFAPVGQPVCFVHDETPFRVKVKLVQEKRER